MSKSVAELRPAALGAAAGSSHQAAGHRPDQLVIVPVHQALQGRRGSTADGRVTSTVLPFARRDGNVVVAVGIAELGRLRGRFGASRARLVFEECHLIAAEVLGVRAAWTGENQGQLIFVLLGSARADVAGLLARLGQALSAHTFNVQDTEEYEHLRITPAIGYVVAFPNGDTAELITRARQALSQAESLLDLVPVRWEPSLDAVPESTGGSVAGTRAGRWANPHPVLTTAVVSTALAVLVPYAGYTALARMGVDITATIYPLIVLALVATSVMIAIEGLMSITAPHPPPHANGADPAATAIIAAYLPNESATIVDTVNAFLRLTYSGPLQIVLAYNTPRPLPVEKQLQELAARNSCLVLLRVEHSTSKAQNVNAALDIASGEIVGIFDADHHPMPEAFTRAWKWLSNGYSVVQGHCVVRNGDASWLSRLIAVEFEMIYAVSHPGRARVHGFGIFGGSNGYWRADALRSVRMRREMLTEDIDSSVRAVLAGHRIASDRGLLSHELAPTTLTALTRQRLRWAQGWFQVTRRHLWSTIKSDELSWQQKAGFTALLGWREATPWLSLQVYPLLAFALAHHTADNLLFPLFVLTTVVTAVTGPAQTVLAYLFAAPAVRRHRRWFIVGALLTAVFFSEYKNALGRVAQWQELRGKRQWQVTPRAVAASVEPTNPRGLLPAAN